jgi:class 3 adenylate cyclase
VIRVRPTRWSARGLSVASLLALAVLVVTVGSLVATGAVALRAGERGSDEVVRDRLGSVRAIRAIQLSGYLDRIQVQTAALAGSEMLAMALQRFTTAYRALDGTALGEAGEEALARFYTDDFLPELAQVPSADVGLGAVLPATDAAAYLQRFYVAEPVPAGDRDELDDAGDGSEWSKAHAELHPALREIADQLGFGDLYLIDPEQAAIVYSVRKATDFATRLDLGPYSGTSLAGVVAEVISAPEPGAVRITDLTAYPPTLDRAQAFLASPVYAGTELVGVLAARVPVERIDQIMTGGGDWTGEGLGTTGEAFVVGPDQRMRSVSREFLEDETGYLAAARDAGTIDAAQGERIAATGNTALVQEVPRTSIAAGTEPSGVTSYLGVPVLATSEPVDVPGLGWTVVMEVSRAEVYAPREDYRRALMVAVAVLVIAVTFFAVLWAGRTIRPVRNLSAAVRRLRGSTDDTGTTTTVDVPPGSPPEFTTLAGRVTTMARSLRAGEQRVRDATGQRLDLLRSLLPPQVAERVERGDRAVVDQIPAATVAVLILSGLGDLARSGAAGGGHRELIGQEIDALDTLAAQHGLEPVKLTGDAYFAACGLGRLYLDHLIRALTFAVEARDAVRSLGTGAGPGLDLAVGVATGPVTVGLAGASRLLYDLWGETVSTAHYLARTARPGQVLVTAAVAGVKLPADLATRRVSEATRESESVWEVGPA